MKALLITTYEPPDPVRDVHGGYLRKGMFIRALGQVAEQVDILYVVAPSYIADHPDPALLSRIVSDHYGVDINAIFAPNHHRRETNWNHYGAGMLALRHQPSFHNFGGAAQVQAIEACLRKGPDLVFAHRLAAMDPLRRAAGAKGRVFFDLDDVEHRVKLRAVTTPPHTRSKLLYAAHIPAIFVAQYRAAQLAEATFVCSELDRRYLRRCGIRSNVVVVPNGVGMPGHAPPVPADHALLFIGTYFYEPNRTAAERLVQRIWPLVRAAAPAAKLIIAGRQAELLPSFAAPPAGVEFTGFVPDLDALYARSRVVCCPIGTGGGTRLKLIEAAGYAKPMVSTALGAEGLDFTDGVEILLRETDAAFAAACVQLLHDDALCARLGAAARTKALALYERRRIEDRIADLMRPPAATA